MHEALAYAGSGGSVDVRSITLASREAVYENRTCDQQATMGQLARSALQ